MAKDVSDGFYRGVMSQRSNGPGMTQGSRTGAYSQLPGRLTAFREFVFVIDLLAANCPASVSSVRQLLSWRLSNHTVYGDLERQLFYSF